MGPQNNIRVFHYCFGLASAFCYMFPPAAFILRMLSNGGMFIYSYFTRRLLCVFAEEARQESTHPERTSLQLTFTSLLLSVSRAESERNPWVELTSSLLTHCQGSEVKVELGHQVVTMVRSLYNTKHKLPAQVSSLSSPPSSSFPCSNLKSN